MIPRSRSLSIVTGGFSKYWWDCQTPIGFSALIQLVAAYDDVELSVRLFSIMEPVSFFNTVELWTTTSHLLLSKSIPVTLFVIIERAGFYNAIGLFAVPTSHWQIGPLWRDISAEVSSFVGSMICFVSEFWKYWHKNGLTKSQHHIGAHCMEYSDHPGTQRIASDYRLDT